MLQPELPDEFLLRVLTLNNVGGYR